MAPALAERPSLRGAAAHRAQLALPLALILGLAGATGRPARAAPPPAPAAPPAAPLATAAPGPQSFEALASLGHFLDENGRLLEAIDVFRQALALAAPLDAELRALEQRGVAPAAELPVACFATPGTGIAEIGAAARRLAPAQPGQALRCLRVALAPLPELRARRADLLYMVGNPTLAQLEHQRVLQRNQDFPESLFFLGALLLEKGADDPAQAAEGRKLWERLLAVAPGHPRAATVRESLPKVSQLFPRKAATAPQQGGHRP
jgi:tetratricopeptide (TPR) repeat protein